MQLAKTQDSDESTFEEVWTFDNSLLKSAFWSRVVKFEKPALSRWAALRCWAALRRWACRSSWATHRWLSNRYEQRTLHAAARIHTVGTQIRNGGHHKLWDFPVVQVSYNPDTVGFIRKSPRTIIIHTLGLRPWVYEYCSRVFPINRSSPGYN